MDVAAQSIRKFRKVTKEISRLSTGRSWWAAWPWPRPASRTGFAAAGAGTPCWPHPGGRLKTLALNADYDEVDEDEADDFAGGPSATEEPTRKPRKSRKTK
jgi:hypothetical protein